MSCPARPVVDRFWPKVDRRGPDECWPWLGAVQQPGYGSFNLGSQTTVAHRVAWELLRGPIPPGLTLDHFRLNPGPRAAPCSTLCVNPAHLEAVTHKENCLRGDSPRARQARQTLCHNGHPFDVFRQGRRNCRRCINATHRAYMARRSTT